MRDYIMLRKNIKSILTFLEGIARKHNIDLNRLIDKELLIPTPLGYIIYKTNDPQYLKYRPGEILITKHNGKSPFKNRIVKLYHEYLHKYWKLKNMDILIGLPCTSVKPYKRSVTHRMMNSYVNKLSKECKLNIEIISISEPMLIVPQRYEEIFPLSNYDFPPKLMDDNEKNYMIEELTKLIPKVLRSVKYEAIFILPRHHYNIVSNVVKMLEYRGKRKYLKKIKLIPYGRLAFKTLYETYYYIYKKYCMRRT
jgi:predicted RNA-binding protein